MRAALDYHFALHEFGRTTRESQQLLHEARERQSLKESSPSATREICLQNEIGPGFRHGRSSLNSMMGLNPRDIGRFRTTGPAHKSVGFDMARMADRSSTPRPWVALTLAAVERADHSALGPVSRTGHAPFYRHGMHLGALAEVSGGRSVLGSAPGMPRFPLGLQVKVDDLRRTIERSAPSRKAAP